MKIAQRNARQLQGHGHSIPSRFQGRFVAHLDERAVRIVMRSQQTCAGNRYSWPELTVNAPPIDNQQRGVTTATLRHVRLVRRGL